ncbi:MAG: glucose 1-dehydrogenase [Desulfamplus sp.]|nr:glucose 1-dehydrogenase [Desulfamplus sp.]
MVYYPRLNELFSLKGKVALITGGGRGIGEFISSGLAEAGADLVITSRKTKNLVNTARRIETAYNVNVMPVQCDVSNKEEVDALIEEVTGSFPRLDILVNNAGVSWGAPTLEYPLEKWDHIFNVNIRGVWILTQKVANIMKEQGGGNIINISSSTSFRGTEESKHPAVAYNSSKAALNLLTMNLAVKLAHFNIRVNGIAPGAFQTDMMAYLEKPEFESVHKEMVGRIPLRLFGTMDDMKGVAVFLASDASAYMTGHILVNDGGSLAK